MWAPPHKVRPPIPPKPANYLYTCSSRPAGCNTSTEQGAEQLYIKNIHTFLYKRLTLRQQFPLHSVHWMLGDWTVVLMTNMTNIQCCCTWTKYRHCKSCCRWRCCCSYCCTTATSSNQESGTQLERGTATTQHSTCQLRGLAKQGAHSAARISARCASASCTKGLRKKWPSPNLKSGTTQTWRSRACGSSIK